MKEGIHIPAIAVRIGAVLSALALIAILWEQIPEARRYMKIEAM